MLKEKDLSTIVTLSKNQRTLSEIKMIIENYAQNNGIDLAIESDQIKRGGMLNSSIADCLIIYHPSHRRDYYNFALSDEGTSFVLYNFGESKNQKKLNNRQAGANTFSAGYKQANKNAAEGKMVGMALGTGALIGGIKALSSIGGSKAKQQEEDAYYSQIIEMVKML